MKIAKFDFDKKRFGATLKAIRKEANFVQDDLANFIGVTRASYCSMENGVYGPQIKVLGRIIQFYDQHKIVLDIARMIGLRQGDGVANAKQLQEKIEALSKVVKDQDQEIAQLKQVNKAQQVTIDALDRTNKQLDQLFTNTK